MIDDDARDVLAFWFDELTTAQWWSVDPQVDAAIIERFGALHARLSETVEPGWMMSPQKLLAAVIVLDQFSRNVHRGAAAAFAQDMVARALAATAIEVELDTLLPEAQRHFLYMPFMHSEDRADQERSVALFTSLGKDQVMHAMQHKAVIDQFGRFPKRNAALGRDSTPEEEAHMAESSGVI